MICANVNLNLRENFNFVSIYNVLIIQIIIAFISSAHNIHNRIESDR